VAKASAKNTRKIGDSSL